MTEPCTPQQLLREARDILADEDRWVMGTWAATADVGLQQQSVAPWDTDAWRYCAIGALAHVTDECKLFTRVDKHGYQVRSMSDADTWPVPLRDAVEHLALTALDGYIADFDEAEFLRDEQNDISKMVQVVTDWNDRVMAHSHILAVFDLAIGRAEQGEHDD